MADSGAGTPSRASKPDQTEQLSLLLGPIAFFVVLIGGLAAAIANWKGADMGAWLQGAGAGTGLLAVGHSIHRSSRESRDRS